MSLHIDVPDKFDDFTDSIIWNKSNESILIRNKKENITIRLEGYEKNTFNKFNSYIENNDYDIFKLKLLNLVHNSDSVTRVGQYDESKVEKVDNRFEYNCESCCEKTTYQIKRKYRGLHAECIYCGNHASTIINNCKLCDEKCVFVKTLDESEYNCYICNNKLD